MECTIFLEVESRLAHFGCERPNDEGHRFGLRKVELEDREIFRSQPYAIARVAAEGFHLLDAAPARVNAKDTPIPYHPNLWSAHRPSSDAIVAKARQLLRE